MQKTRKKSVESLTKSTTDPHPSMKPRQTRNGQGEVCIHPLILKSYLAACQQRGVYLVKEDTPVNAPVDEDTSHFITTLAWWF